MASEAISHETKESPSFVKVGAAYNVFDGVELLEASIRSIRPVVSYVVVVYQTSKYESPWTWFLCHSSSISWHSCLPWFGLLITVHYPVLRHLIVWWSCDVRWRVFSYSTSENSLWRVWCDCGAASNFGAPASPALLPTLQKLYDRKLIDSLFLYAPRTFTDVEKRNGVSPIGTPIDFGTLNEYLRDTDHECGH